MWKRSLAVVLSLLLSAIPGAMEAAGQEVYLNEILASNDTTLADEDGDNEDWIELFNAGSEAVRLEGYGLSDDYDRPFRWVLPDLTLAPGEFLLIWASGKDRRDAGSELHTNFSIAAAGEEVLLTNPEGVRVDELSPTTIPTDVSLGRQPDGTGDWFFFHVPTPGRPNDTQASGSLADAPDRVPLFASNERLEVTLTADLYAVLQDVGDDRSYHPAHLTYVTRDGDPSRFRSGSGRVAISGGDRRIATFPRSGWIFGEMTPASRSSGINPN